MTNIVLPTFPALASGALFVKGFEYSAAAHAAYVSFGHSFQIGQFPAGGGLQVSFGAAPEECQVDVKTTYADGSAAWAVITVVAPNVSAAEMVWGQFSLAAASTSPALGLGTALGSTALSLIINVTTPSQVFQTDLVALIKSAAFDPWLNGPLAVQGRAMVTLYQGLRAQVDLTAYADGTVNASVVVANDIAMLPAAGTVNYTATLDLNGAVAYSSPALTHYQYQNWRVQVGTHGALPRVIHNPADFIAAQCIMPYDLELGVDPSIISWLGGIAPAAPLMPGPLDQGMSGTGGRPDIGMNSGWSVPFFTTQDPTAMAGALNAANASGSVPWHFFNAATGAYLTTADIPNLWTQPGDPGGCTVLTQGLSTVLPPTGWTLDSSHNPDVCYIPALLTGDRYYLDELNAMTAWHINSFWPAPRQNGLGLLADIQIRAAAWAMRDLLYSAYLSPDGSAEKAYAKTILTNNFTFFNNWTPTLTQVQGQSAGWCPNWWYTYSLPPWQDDFLFAAASLAAIMGFPGALQFCQWKAGFTVGRFLQPDFDPKNGCAYNISVFSNTNDGWPAGNGVADAVPAAGSSLQTTWAGIQAATVAHGQSNTGNTGWPHSQGYYAQNGWVSLVNAQILGIENSAEAFTWLQGSGAPFIDPVSWATSNEIYRTAVHPWTASRIFAAAAPADPAITGITLSADTFVYGATAGTVVGEVSVAMTGGTFSGTLALAGANAADFAISGANLVTVGTLAPGAYAVSVVATQAGATGSPFTQTFTVTGAAQPQPAAAQLVATAQADFAKVVSAAAAIGKAAAALKTTEAENLEAAIVGVAGQVADAEKLLATVTADLAAVAGAV